MVYITKQLTGLTRETFYQIRNFLTLRVIDDHHFVIRKPGFGKKTLKVGPKNTCCASGSDDDANLILLGDGIAHPPTANYAARLNLNSGISRPAVSLQGETRSFDR